MFELTNNQQTAALVFAIGVAVTGFLLSLVLMWRLSSVRREYSVVRGETGDQDVVAAVSRSMTRVEEINRRMDALWADQQGQQEVHRLALQKYAIVRYNAFEDVGGMLSFSLALLNDYGDGVVISSINGRTETRTYAKEVNKLESEHNLSEEERRAIAAAFSGGAAGQQRGAVQQRARGPQRLVSSQRR